MPREQEILIGQLLVQNNIITIQQLETALTEQKKTGLFLCALLVKLGFASEESIFNILSRQLNIPYVNIRGRQLKEEVIHAVPAKFAYHYKILPIELADNVLTVAMADPLDIRTTDDLSLLLGVEVKSVLSGEKDIMEAIRSYYGVGAETLEKMVASDMHRVAPEKALDIEAMSEDASVIKFVNQILSQAIRDRATDIHLEPYHNELRVRFRTDGLLYNVNIPETIAFFQPAIVSRIKIMSGLNITEKRLPQDGRIEIRLNEQELDLRVSVIPTIFGESVQIRVLSAGQFMELEKLGLLGEDRQILEKVIKKTHGIVFVSGPTGSGKSTTLYACLHRINDPSLKIITIEDPVEYQMRGISQIQVVPFIGFSFKTALRHMLRHDPDVMMVGEVRDFETAEIAIRSALTGHLVFSTLHTNDAAGVVTRLLDMGIEPFLVSSSLECLIAQRLVRTLCPKCRRPMGQEKRQEALAFLKGQNMTVDGETLFEGPGCEFCRFTGYWGRTGIYEVIPVTGAIRDLIVARATSQQIKQTAVNQGMKTLRQDGLKKFASGVTSLMEVLRVTQESDGSVG